jgi:hypothetical protein
MLDWANKIIKMIMTSIFNTSNFKLDQAFGVSRMIFNQFIRALTCWAIFRTLVKLILLIEFKEKKEKTLEHMIDSQQVHQKIPFLWFKLKKINWIKLKTNSLVKHH